MSNENGGNVQTQIPVDQSPLMIFQGRQFLIHMPTNWLIVTEEDGTVGFIGPKVGAARAGFTVKAAEKVSSNPQGTLSTVAQQVRDEQEAQRSNFTVLSEQDLSTDAFLAYSHHVHWYNPAIDMVILQRQLFSLHAGQLYTLTSSVPNSPHKEAFDRLFLKMIGSFRYGGLNL